MNAQTETSNEAGGWIRMVKEGRRWRREVFCPQCGRRMDLFKEARYVCENPKCAVIEVRIRRDGAVEILLDSVKPQKKLWEETPRGSVSLSASSRGRSV